MGAESHIDKDKVVNYCNKNKTNTINNINPKKEENHNKLMMINYCKKIL